MQESSMKIYLKPISKADKNWVREFITKHWGSPQIVARGKVNKVDDLPGFIAYLGDKAVGLITYKTEGSDCEIVSLDSIEEKKGIGIMLINKVKQIAQEKKCKRVVVVTTNDNLNALGFYQRRGFILTRVYSNALEASRKIKPQIPLIGMNKIPLRDEIELEYKVDLT
jgi:GNAT superfamily N-acetyltransferase